VGAVRVGAFHERGSGFLCLVWLRVWGGGAGGRFEVTNKQSKNIIINKSGGGSE
jgi:hypothetical protein